MNNQTKIGFTLIGSATAMSAGYFTELVSMPVAHFLAGVFMFGMAYFSYRKDGLVSAVGVSSLALVFVTLSIRGATEINLFPLASFLLVVGILGAFHNIVSGIRG